MSEVHHLIHAIHPVHSASIGKEVAHPTQIIGYRIDYMQHAACSMQGISSSERRCGLLTPEQDVIQLCYYMLLCSLLRGLLYR